MIRPRVRTLLHLAGTASAVGALALGAPGLASAQTSGGTWAGYVADSTTYTSVSATWVQPKVTCSGTSDSYVAFWVGLDGYTDSTVEQIGTEAECVSGTAEYFAWYELYPAYQVVLSQTVAAGDSITATVSATTKDVFTLAIKNTTKGWSKSSQSTDTSAKRASAEVVLEVPVTSGVLPIASGTVTYTDAKVDGANLGAANPTEFNGSAATCGTLVGGTKFTCTWQ
jgi:hypothetical protein